MRMARFIDDLAELAPKGNRRMGGNPHVNGGRLLNTLDLPDFAEYALEIPGRAGRGGGATKVGRVFPMTSSS